MGRVSEWYGGNTSSFMVLLAHGLGFFFVAAIPYKV